MSDNPTPPPLTRRTYVAARMMKDDYETVRERDELDRVRDWPNGQDCEPWFDDAAGEAVEDKQTVVQTHGETREQMLERRIYGDGGHGGDKQDGKTDGQTDGKPNIKPNIKPMGRGASGAGG